MNHDTNRRSVSMRGMRSAHLTKWLAAALLLSVGMTSLPLTASAEKETIPLASADVQHDNRAYDWVETKRDTYTYDFTSTNIITYSRDEHLATAGLRTNMVFDGKTLSCKEGKTFSFGSSVFLGDDYGLYGGELSFDSTQTGGQLSVGLRLSLKAASSDRRGLWFTFDGTDRLTVTESESGLKAEINGVKADGHLVFRDESEIIRVLNGDKLLATVEYELFGGGLTVFDADGKQVSAVKSTSLPSAGYATVYADSLVGSIDNLSFTHTDVTRRDTVTGSHAVDFSSWEAVDDLNRPTPMGQETGGVRDGKKVGLFYFISQVGADSEDPLDITYLYHKLGLDGLKAHLEDPRTHGGFYWSEPYYGYYRNTDEWVFRKHAYMLEAAGVDFIFLDMTNGAVYPESVQKLFDTWLSIRNEGGQTPEICIFGAGQTETIMNVLRGSIYSDENWSRYEPLFYKHDGKPLYLGNRVRGNQELMDFVKEKFTIRSCEAWHEAKRNTWKWLQEYVVDEKGPHCSNGGFGLDGKGELEELALCVGHHPTTSKGRSFYSDHYPTIQNNDFGFSLDSGAGLGFAESFKAIMYFDPNVVLITGWNEWTAGLNHDPSVKEFAGSQVNGYYMVDQFSPEYSRDAEPMKIRDGEGSVGFGDNYYYQMTSMIRTYKGFEPVKPAAGQISVRMDRPEDWANIGPVFTDYAGDTAWRSQDGFFKGYTYVNATGRNDLTGAQVSQDADYLYFRVDTAQELIMDDGSNWMNLFLDLDDNSQTGWEGFDFVLNRARDGHYVSVESLADGWGGEHIGQALYAVNGSTLVIRLSKSTVKLMGHVDTFRFKWADHSTVSGEVMEFMDLGDTAPNDRFAFRYVCSADEGTGASSDVAYTLLTANGSVGERDESKPLPSLSGEQTETTREAVPAAGRRYSTALKVLIVALGATTGLCGYAALVLPGVIRKKKQKK